MNLLTLLYALSLAAPSPAPHRVDFGTCQLRGGGVIEDCHLDYQWFGTPNADASNVIVIPTWFSGNSDAAGKFMAHGGMLDDTRYALLVIDTFGNGTASSPSNSRTQRGMRFPQVSIADMVEWQYRLVHDELGFQHVKSVVGISMGGMQALQWAVSYPDFMESIINLVGTPKPTPADVAIWYPQIFAFENLARLGDVHRADAALQLRTMLTQDLAAGLPLSALARRVKARTLMVLDKNDTLLRPGPSLELAEILHSQVLMSNSACGHLAPALCERGTTKIVMQEFLMRGDGSGDIDVSAPQTNPDSLSAGFEELPGASD